MRAFLNDGKGLGSDHSTVTGEYKTIGTLYRYAVRPFLKFHGGFCKAEIYYNWDNRYGTPDKVMTWNEKINGKDNFPNYCHPTKCDQCSANVINGVFCHEHGCPNQNKIWDRINGEWTDPDIRDDYNDDY